ncbi:uncharacterized protein [Periplaneta americana]|uniref:uncharacterized protein n=1 Tax=Periplaneta americana TaxID=6978 RepID=UPI0037E898BC
MRTLPTFVLGIAVTFLAMPTLGSSTYVPIALGPRETSGTRSGVAELLDRLLGLSTPEPDMDVGDFFLNSYEQKSTPDLGVLGDDEDEDNRQGGLDWLLGWADNKCLKSRIRILLECVLDILTYECNRFSRIRATVMSFLDTVLLDCSKSSTVTRFVKRLVSMILSNCNNKQNKIKDWRLRLFRNAPYSK